MKQSELYNAIASVNMKSERKEQIRQHLNEAYLAEQAANGKPVPHPKKRVPRFAIAAALALCLVGIPLTSYAAIHYNWFTLFFREEKNTSTLKQLEQYATPLEETLETTDLTINLLGDLYSKEQNMGILLCSLHFEKDGDKDSQRLWIDMGEKEDAKYDVGYTCYLTPSGTESLGTDTENLTEPEAQKNEYGFVGDDGTLVSTYYDGTMAEDGGYLLGIRYAGDSQNKPDITLQKQTVTGNNINLEPVLSLPVTQKGMLPCKEYTCKETGSKLLLSPIGISFFNLEKEDPDEEWLNTVKILNTTYFIKNDGDAVWLSDMTTDACLQEKNPANKNQFYMQQEFLTLLNPDDIASVRIYQQDKNIKRTEVEMKEAYSNYITE